MITSHWNTPEEFHHRIVGPYGLQAWIQRSEYLFSPDVHIIACGTWSDPEFAHKAWPADYGVWVEVVNSGTEWYGAYDVLWKHYALAATVAGFYFCLNIPDWDLVVHLDNDVLVGDVNFDSLLREFMKRPQEVLSPAWAGCPGGPFFAWKRAGLSRFVNYRARSNFYEQPIRPVPPMAEMEYGKVMAGRWWNPWPHLPSCRQDHPQEPLAAHLNEQVMSWPFVRLPHPDIVDKYLLSEGMKTKPVLTDAAPIGH